MSCCNDLRNTQQETETVFLKMAGLIDESVHGLKEDGLGMQKIDWNEMNRNFDDKVCVKYCASYYFNNPLL